MRNAAASPFSTQPFGQGGFLGFSPLLARPVWVTHRPFARALRIPKILSCKCPAKVHDTI